MRTDVYPIRSIQYSIIAVRTYGTAVLYRYSGLSLHQYMYRGTVWVRVYCTVTIVNTVQYGTVWYGTVRYSTVWYSTVPHDPVD